MGKGHPIVNKEVEFWNQLLDVLHEIENAIIEQNKLIIERHRKDDEYADILKQFKDISSDDLSMRKVYYNYTLPREITEDFEPDEREGTEEETE